MAAERSVAAQELDEAECRRLLATATVGRLSFTAGALPTIVPVPFALHDEQVLIPARRSSPMLIALRGAVVAFGVDSFDAGTETGWSVTVVGPSHVVPDFVGVLGLRAAGLPQAWTGPGRCCVRVQIGLLRGWRQSDDAPAPAPGRP